MALNTLAFTDAQQLNTEFADTIARLLSSEINTAGTASLVVSGGRTPMGLFEALSKKQIDWSRVVVTLVDDRWVDEGHDDSNAKLVKTHLLKNEAAAARFVSLKTEHEDAYDAESSVEELLKDIEMPFTVIILGMGEDGHTASLFPCSNELKKGLDRENKNRCLAVTPKTAPHQRMSLTLNSIVTSKNVFLHLTGTVKKQVLEKAMTADSEIKPIVSVINQAEVSLYWAP
jgi:6-phosphogluconolactonase